MNNIIDGNAVARKVMARNKRLRKKLKGKNPRLLVFRIGQNAASSTYIKKKQEVAERLDIDVRVVVLRGAQARVESQMKNAMARYRPQGVIVQLPLPVRYNTQKVLDCVPADLDIDGLSSASLGMQATGLASFEPPVVGSILEIAKTYKIDFHGKKVALVGMGRLVGKPLMLRLADMHTTIITIDEFTKNKRELTQCADIIVTGVGKPNILHGADIQKGAVVFDAGFTIKHGKIYGDVHAKSVLTKALWLTPVPGGIGSLTVAKLLENLLMASRP